MRKVFLLHFRHQLQIMFYLWSFINSSPLVLSRSKVGGIHLGEQYEEMRARVFLSLWAPATNNSTAWRYAKYFNSRLQGKPSSIKKAGKRKSEGGFRAGEQKKEIM